MASYVIGTSWRDFLQTQKFTDQIELAIQTQTLKQIASDKELARDGARVYRETSVANTDRIVTAASEAAERLVAAQRQASEQITDAVFENTRITAEGFTLIHYDLKGIDQAIRDQSTAIQDQTALIDWRLSQIVGTLGQIDTSFDTLIKLARTPSQTWSYEQFEIAREAFTRGLYDEAIIALGHAISGFGSHTGYPLEPRFHYLVGTIYLTVPELLDLSKAEKAFDRSAQVAGNQNHSMASRAHCASGYASLCSRDLERARKAFDASLSHDPANAEAAFLSGKLHCHQKAFDKAVKDLITAIRQSRRFAARAAGDSDYLGAKGVLERAEQNVRDDIQRTLNALMHAAVRQVDDIQRQLRGVESKIYPIGERVTLGGRQIVQDVQQVQELMSSGTLFGLTDAQIPAGRLIGGIVTMKDSAHSWLNDVIVRAQKDADKIIRSAQAKLPDDPFRQEDLRETENLWARAAFLIVGLSSWGFFVVDGYQKNGSGEAIAALMLGWLWAGAFGGMAALLGFLAGGFAAAARRSRQTKRMDRQRNAIDRAVSAAQKVVDDLKIRVADIDKAIIGLTVDNDSRLRFAPIGFHISEAAPWAKP